MERAVDHRQGQDRVEKERRIWAGVCGTVAEGKRKVL